MYQVQDLWCQGQFLFCKFSKKKSFTEVHCTLYNTLHVFSMLNISNYSASKCSKIAVQVYAVKFQCKYICSAIPVQVYAVQFQCKYMQ